MANDFVKRLRHAEQWQQYTRRGTHEFRARTRYKGVADRLFWLGLADNHTLLDVGAGTCGFGLYLRSRGWSGIYSPVDAIVDGTNLETWSPQYQCVDFAVCIETVEHVHRAKRLLKALESAACRAVVLTTPNSENVDVLGCDATHVSVVSRDMLLKRDYSVQRESWFGTTNDTLLAWKDLAYVNA